MLPSIVKSIQMKHSIFIILLFSVISIGSAFAQQYYPLVKDSASWNYVTVNLALYPWENDTYYTNRYGIFGDTIINSKSYKKVYYIDCFSQSFDITTSTYYGAVREDSLKKVYLNLNSVDYLQYDFQLSIGDTFHYEDPLWPDDLYVNNIDSILINGNYRKRYEVYPHYSGWTGYWIEGIGNTASLFLYLFPHGNFNNYLSCYYENFDLIHDPYPQCCEFTTNIESINSNNNLVVFPNPTSKHLNIRFSNEENRVIQLYDCQSRLILSKSFDNCDVKLSINDITSGIYILKIIENNSIIERKIIINNAR